MRKVLKVLKGIAVVACLYCVLWLLLQWAGTYFRLLWDAISVLWR